MAVPEAFQTGVDALGGTGVEDRPEFLQAWKDAPERTPEEIQAAQLGMRTAADNLINGRRFSARNGQNVGEVPFNVQKMNILLGPGEGDGARREIGRVERHRDDEQSPFRRLEDGARAGGAA